MADSPEGFLPLENYLPHRGAMLLLDTVVALDEERAVCTITISENCSFYVPGKGVPAWIGLEYMGQTAALMGGFLAHASVNPGKAGTRVGYLLGTRRYSCALRWFEPGTVLGIECELAGAVGADLARYECKIVPHGNTNTQGSGAVEILASAQLSVMNTQVA